MSFESSLMKFVERMLIFGRRREAKKHPDDVEKLAKIDRAITGIRGERAAALDKDIAAKQQERSDLG